MVELHVVGRPQKAVRGSPSSKLEELSTYDLKIYSSRSSQEGGIEAMQSWLKHWLIKEYGWEIGSGIGNMLTKSYSGVTNCIRYEYFPTEKPPAYITIDDRVWLFVGVFPTFEQLDNFKPWNK